MIFLKAFILLLMNVLAGFLLVQPVRWFLFFPKKQLHWFGKPVPFTPGFLRRKKTWFFTKVNFWVKYYLENAANRKDRSSKLWEWEHRIYDETYNKLDGVMRMKYLPAPVKEKIREILALFVYEFARHFLRSFVPFLVKKYELTRYIDLIEAKADVDQVMMYFDKYFHRYVTYFMLGLSGLIGLFNFVIYLLLQLF